MAILALALGILVLSGKAQLWHVYCLAFALGCASAFDAPVRHAFVGNIVSNERLATAIALNSASFNLSRLAGPSIGGMLISMFGSGWLFIINAASFTAVIGSLVGLRTKVLSDRGTGHGAGISEAIGHVWSRTDLRALFSMIVLFALFGLSFPILIATTAVSVFGLGATEFGFLTSELALGALVGALIVAWCKSVSFGFVVSAYALISIGYLLASFANTIDMFGLSLILIGAAFQAITTSSISLVQLETSASMRGRTISLFLTLGLGCQAAGGPMIGWLVDHVGSRATMLIASSGCGIAAFLGIFHIVRHGPGRSNLAGTAQSQDGYWDNEA